MKYSKYFFQDLQEGSGKSAETVVPYIIELFSPKSVIDVGCGVGTWLSVFINMGIKSALGLDGYYLKSSLLKIPQKNFKVWDLTKPIRIKKRFDLAICLEVAEHLEKESANTLIDSLTRLSDVILFSAAIPLQGGTHHVNEQWPEYWRDIFSKKNYLLIDCLRFKFWNDDKVKPWYAQNMFIYLNKSKIKKYPMLIRYEINPVNIPLAVVHPKNYLNRTIRKREIVKMIARIIKNKIV